jgi:hypothetical protein
MKSCGLFLTLFLRVNFLSAPRHIYNQLFVSGDVSPVLTRSSFTRIPDTFLLSPRPHERRYANPFFFFWDHAESFLPFPIFVKIFSFPASSRTTKDTKTACKVYGGHFFRKYIEKSGPQVVLVLRTDFSKNSQK